MYVIKNNKKKSKSDLGCSESKPFIASVIKG